MHRNRMLPYLAVAAVVAAVLIAAGAPLASLLPFGALLVCPLLMVSMMRACPGPTATRSEDPIRSLSRCPRTAISAAPA